MLDQIRLRTLLITALVAMLVASVGLIGFVSWRYQTIARDSKLASISDLILHQAGRAEYSLTHTLLEMIMNAQRDSELRRKIVLGDREDLPRLLDSWFRQNLVTSHKIDLQRLYVFDETLQRLAASTTGYILENDSVPICDRLINEAKNRSGYARLQTNTTTCSVEGRGFLAALVPVGAFKPVGYLLAVIDFPAGLNSLYDTLGIPLYIQHPNGAVAFSSPDWNASQASLGNRALVMRRDHRSIKGEVVATLTAIHRIEDLAENYTSTIVGTAIAGLMMLGALFGFAGWILKKTIVPLSLLKSGAERVTQGDFHSLERTRFSEINNIIDAFNAMTMRTAHFLEQQRAAKAALEAEIAVRQRTERQAREQEHRIRAVYNVAALSPTVGFDEHIGEILRVGCRLFGLDSALVTQINAQRNECTVLGVIAPSHVPLRCGMVLPLQETYCKHAFDIGTLVINHASNSKWAQSDAFHSTKEENHIATAIYVNGVKFGTLSFASTTPRKEPYRDTDIDLVKLIGRLAGTTIERETARRELDDARQQSESANQAKSEFLANISHEIRNPMNAIYGYAQLLERDSQLTPRQRRAVETICSSGQHLLDLVNDVLDLSKIEARRMPLHTAPFDLRRTLDEIENMFAVRCTEKGLKWTSIYDNRISTWTVAGDVRKLRQALINLLANAVKFTDQGGVTLTVTLLQADVFNFMVADTGPGVTKDSTQRIFEPFSQAEEGNKKGGTGLGLTLATRQIELMGGHLEMDSQPNQGARFYFTLRLPAITIDLPKPTPLPPKRVQFNQHLRALVVDDVSVNRQLLRELAEDCGLEVCEASNGEDALQQAERFNPAVIFLDQRMPKRLGTDTTRALRQRYGDAIKIVMVSALAYEQNAEEFRQAGVDATLRKPLIIEQLETVLSDLFPRALRTDAEVETV